jgi:hypothetical protein
MDVYNNFSNVGSTTHTYKPACSGGIKQKIRGRGIIFNLWQGATYLISSTLKN